MESIRRITRTFSQQYKKTPLKLKVIDVFLFHALFTAAVQFGYMLLMGTFPFNSFLAGFLCCAGFFVLTVSLRLQVDPSNKDFKGMSPERAFADYCFCSATLLLLVWNFMG